MDVNDIDIMMGTFTKSFGAAGTLPAPLTDKTVTAPSPRASELPVRSHSSIGSQCGSRRDGGMMVGARVLLFWS